MVYLDPGNHYAIWHLILDPKYRFPKPGCEQFCNSGSDIFHHPVIFRTFADVNQIEFPCMQLLIFIQSMPLDTFFFGMNQVFVLNLFQFKPLCLFLHNRKTLRNIEFPGIDVQIDIPAFH